MIRPAGCFCRVEEKAALDLDEIGVALVRIRFGYDGAAVDEVLLSLPRQELWQDHLLATPHEHDCAQCDINVGMVIDSSISRVTPPNTASLSREWP